MSLLKIIRVKSDDFIRRYNVTKQIEIITSSENIRLIGWAFIISRVYYIYHLVYLIS